MLLTQNYSPQPIQHSHQQSTSFYSHHLDIDSTLDGSVRDLAGAAISSPHSTQSLLSQYSAAESVSLPAFNTTSAAAIPRGDQTGDLLSTSTLDGLPLGQDQIADLMQSDSWFLGQFTPKSVGRLSHNRESSLSSLGSAGPASPFSHNTSNPQIAITDSGSDGFGDMHNDNYYQLAKTMGPNDAIYAQYQPFNTENALAGMRYPAMAAQKARADRNLLPAPDFASAFSRSHPTSVASSVAGDSPATPSLGEPEDDRRRKVAFNTVSKLDRTMSDVFGDELYNPDFAIAPSPTHSHVPLSPGNDVFTQRLQAANNQHLAVGHSPISPNSRGRSPFQQGSPLAPAPAHDFGSSTASAMRLHSAQQMRELNNAERGAQALRHQMARRPEPDTPKTISPKDAVLEFHEADGDANFPLFPSQDSSALEFDRIAKAVGMGDSYKRSAANGITSMPGASSFYATSQLGAGIQVPQQYPFITQPQAPHGSSPHLSSAASSSAGSTPARVQKPTAGLADGGTYTCTYHGCTLRFETPALLQKHKREGHRQAQGIAGLRRSDNSTPASLLNSQAGPHKCERINPSTGKPCNTIFSRPYDLTRHEDTIHNARKQKVRCGLCTEEKTFSRADALTRHYRVCHPDVELGGKQRRRGGHS